MKDMPNIDLHMHSTVSDGTDTPEELLEKVREAGIRLFALTDHDAVKGCGIIRGLLRDGDPQLLSGVEFSCRDEEGKYHILGYGFDPDSAPVRQVMEEGNRLRMKKLLERLEFLKTAFGFDFPQEEIQSLLALDNPGKPHIGNLMVKYGYAESRDQAIKGYIDKLVLENEHLRPEEAIRSILLGGGVPVLAHPSFGSGDELIIGGELERRLRRLMEFGLQGLEAFYSGFSAKLEEENLCFADKFRLYVTAGSDYHGSNKLVRLGDTDLDKVRSVPDGMRRFFERIQYRLA